MWSDKEVLNELPAKNNATKKGREATPEGTAACGWTAASLAGEWPALPAATSSPLAKLMRIELLGTNRQSWLAVFALQLTTRATVNCLLFFITDTSTGRKKPKCDNRRFETFLENKQKE